MTQPSPIEHSVQPYYVRHREDWAINNERDAHKQAMWISGEPVLFTLLWKVEDFEAGLVEYCVRCRPDATSIEGRIAAVYKQPKDANCPVCYGTMFGQGIRAQIIRPAIVTDADEDQVKSARGVVHPENVTIESTQDFRSRTGDLVFRRDGTRWQLGRPSRIMLRTGYEHPDQEATSLGYARIPAAREDEASVAFRIPPSAEQLVDYLSVTDFFPEAPLYEQINGPLIPSVGE
jgi:hypothetical protein